MRNGDAAEINLAPLGEGVHVETLADAHVGQGGQKLVGRAQEILRRGQLEVLGVARENMHRRAHVLGDHGVVGELDLGARASAMRGEDEVERESLRRLHPA